MRHAFQSKVGIARQALSRKTLVRGIGCLLPALLAILISDTPAARAQSPRPTLIELFTSQGCSSCPSADALFESYTKRPDVIALSYSVHYWDSLGWKDTLANPKFTDRQKAYAKQRGDGQVYTPQVVVDGIDHTVGSDKTALDTALATNRTKRQPWYPVTLSQTASGPVVEIPASASVASDATIWLATVTRRVDVAVKRGENAGRTLSYFNAVRSLTKIGRYDGTAVSQALDQTTIDQSEADQIVVLVQNGMAGPIVGAAALALK